MTKRTPTPYVPSVRAPEFRKPKRTRKPAVPGHPAPVADALLAEVSKYPAGTPLVVLELAHTINRTAESVRSAIKRLRAAGRWHWPIRGAHDALRSKMHDLAHRQASARIATACRARVTASAKKPVDLSTNVMIHGPGCLNRIDSRNPHGKT